MVNDGEFYARELQFHLLAERLALTPGQGVVIEIKIVGFMPVAQRRLVRRLCRCSGVH